jgi:hypothetical protein
MQPFTIVANALKIVPIKEGTGLNQADLRSFEFFKIISGRLSVSFNQMDFGVLKFFTCSEGDVLKYSVNARVK